jgi:hypothetical protein
MAPQARQNPNLLGPQPHPGQPFSRWSVQPFVVCPLPFPIRILDDLSPKAEEDSQVQEPRMHPFLLAQSWREQMEHDAQLNKTRQPMNQGER